MNSPRLANNRIELTALRAAAHAARWATGHRRSFESEQKTLASYNLDFLRALCASIGVPWLEALP